MLVLDDRKVYKEYLMHDGFSEWFVDNFIIPMHFDFRMDPSDTKTSEWAQKILKRPPKPFLEWARENTHLFVD